MANNDEPNTEPQEQELVITRVFDAPRELVFKAWTEPEHVMRWWGPKGYTTSAFAADRAGADLAHRDRWRDASRVSRDSVADHAGWSATTRHENLRSIGPGQHEFVNGDARESAGVCKRRVGVKEID